MEDLTIAVLAMREEDVKNYPEGVSNFIKKSYSEHPNVWKTFLGQSIEDLEGKGEKWVIQNFIKKSYSGHPHGWRPFLDQPIEDLIREAGGEEGIDINFIFIKLIREDLENLDSKGLKKKFANFNDLNLHEAIVLYIIDCFSLEIEWISRIVDQVDTFSKIGCITPIYEDYPKDLKKRMRELRNDNLCIKHEKFNLPGECYDEASTTDVFKRKLQWIAMSLVNMKIRGKGTGEAQEHTLKHISDSAKKRGFRAPDKLSEVNLSSRVQERGGS